MNLRVEADLNADQMGLASGRDATLSCGLIALS
jgi:hypothetical protein